MGSLVFIAAGCVVVAAQRERHQLGTNWVRPVAFVVDLPAGERLCQPGMRVPAGTGGVGLRVGTYDRLGPRLELTIRAQGEPPVRGVLAPGWRQGDIVVPIPALSEQRRGARVCLEHDGERPLAIAGGTGVGDALRIDGAVGGAMVRLEYVEGRSATWFAVVPEMVDRLAVARDALPAAASLPLFAVLVLGVLGGALLLVVREGRH